MLDKMKRFFRVPKKHHIEFITALLSIPVLLTVFALNWNNLNTNKDTDKKPEIIISLPPQKNDPTQIPTKAQCKAGIGATTISSPQEGETTSDNPVDVIITYNPGDYCAAVWSYRINSGAWSDYDDKSIAIYNPPSGNIQLEVRVKSIVNGQQKTLTRNFTYKSSSPTLTPTATPTITPSPTQAPSTTPTQ